MQEMQEKISINKRKLDRLEETIKLLQKLNCCGQLRDCHIVISANGIGDKYFAVLEELRKDNYNARED